MLILADRNFAGYPLVSQFFQLGAALIWRVQGGWILPRLAEFADDSYLSVITEPQDGRRRAMARHRARPLAAVPRGIPVRVIETGITIQPAAGPPRTEFYRLIATLYNTWRVCVVRGSVALPVVTLSGLSRGVSGGGGG
jgi:hypothetical protein